ncbi:hypothetical protein B0H14DRAFT_225960 [Mycena olivaceomarginata]|nr:hypothetical protein B0H14DRAFT_225960 [Mycena olivaceomarginata]
MAHETARYVWAIVSPSARLSVAYLKSMFATSAADALDLENGEYLALMSWKDNTNDPMDEITSAYLVQSVTFPLPPTYLPILPCRLGPRSPLVPDFRWPFEDCVVDTSKKFVFKHAISAGDFRALAPAVSKEVVAIFKEDDTAHHRRAELEYLVSRKAEHDAAGLADDGDVWATFSADSTRAAVVPGAFFPPSWISAQARSDIESFKLSLPARRLFDDERKVKILRARFSRPSTERAIVWTLNQAPFLHEYAPLPEIVPEIENPTILELLANLDRPLTPDPSEEPESVDDEELDEEAKEAKEYEECYGGYDSEDDYTITVPAYETVPSPRFDPDALRVVYFHVYGTLVDHETGIFDALQPLISRSAYGFERHEALSLYFEIEDEVKKRTPSLPYVEILARAYDDLSIRLGLTSTEEEAAVFASSLFTWPLFDGAVECLLALGPLALLVGLIDMGLEIFEKNSSKLPRPTPSLRGVECSLSRSGIGQHT